MAIGDPAQSPALLLSPEVGGETMIVASFFVLTGSYLKPAKVLSSIKVCWKGVPQRYQVAHIPQKHPEGLGPLCQERTIFFFLCLNAAKYSELSVS